VKGIKEGACDGCGRKGVISWVKGREDIVERMHTLVSYGAGYHCCNDRCYEQARRKGGKKR
jgi:hypothetical protein